MPDLRIAFDFDIHFANGGGLQGQDFRLDIEDEAISDQALGEYVIADLRLLMVSKVTISNRRIISEPHKRKTASAAAASGEAGPAFVDLSHTIEGGMITYKGMPAPLICDHISRAQSKGLYAPGTEFQIGRMELVGNTGTYLDTPFHRYEDGYDLNGLMLNQVSDVPGLVVNVTGAQGRAIDWTHFAAAPVQGKAVLVHTGWDRHWRTDAYFEGHTYLTAAAATYLRDHGATLVGIDSYNIDTTDGGERPVHTILLGAGIPIVEHMTNLAALPASDFRFFAAPPKISGMGTFPVRAHAILKAER
jgi:kynurenine formamidase